VRTRGKTKQGGMAIGQAALFFCSFSPAERFVTQCYREHNDALLTGREMKNHSRKWSTHQTIPHDANIPK
jgi:hypothetical protein